MHQSDLSTKEIKYRKELKEKIRKQIRNPSLNQQSHNHLPLPQSDMTIWRSHGWFEGIPLKKEEDDSEKRAFNKD